MTVVGVLEFGGWYVAAGFVEAPVVEPVDLLQGGDLDVLGGAPGAAGLDQLGLEQADRWSRRGRCRRRRRRYRSTASIPAVERGAR